jgi:hypothetical protein
VINRDGDRVSRYVGEDADGDDDGECASLKYYFILIYD